MVLRRNILIFHQGALGDFVVTWPLAVALARLYPQSRLFYVTSGQKGALAEKALRVESLDIESGGWHHLFAEPANLPAPSAKALSGAHSILSFMAAPDDQWTRNVQAANPAANLLTISTLAPAERAGHQTEFLIEQLRPWPAAEEAARQILRAVLDHGLGNWKGGDGGIVIHPGSGAGKKCWAPQRYLALIRKLRDAGLSTRVLLGEVESEQWPARLIADFHAATDVKTPKNLADLLAQTISASLFIGNDSGPGHLAGIIGVPTLSLFGQTSVAARWKPLSGQAVVLQKSLDALEVDEVFDAALAIHARRSEHISRAIPDDDEG